jgi:transglutaminase-like putative cysteine protease
MTMQNLKRKGEDMGRRKIMIIFLLLAGVFSWTQFPDAIYAKEVSKPVICRNPRVYNVDYTFELFPDLKSINRNTDLKVWIPVPREWASQQAVRILAIEPEPHAEYTDPEYGNPILFWDFGKEAEKSSYRIHMRYRMEIFEIHAEIDPEEFEPYDKSSEEYALYTRSTHSIALLPEIREMAKKAIGKETNPYLQARQLFKFVRNAMQFKLVRHIRGSGIQSIVNYPITDQETGEVHYEGQCDHFSALFVALCRAAGIPARGVLGMVGWGPWVTEKDATLRSKHHTELSPDGLAAARLYGPFLGHIWAEFYLPEYGWIPVDPTFGEFGHQRHSKFILSKGRDIKIGPHAPQETYSEYGDQWIPLYEGRANSIGYGVWNIAKIRIAKATFLHTSDPFPADGYAEYAENLYPESDAAEKLRDWRGEILYSFYHAAQENQHTNDLFKINPQLNENREAFMIHALHRIAGNEKFKQIFQIYLDRRLTTGKAVSTQEFQKFAEQIYGKSLENFINYAADNTALPNFALKNIRIEKLNNEWEVYGSLLLKGEPSIGLPIEVVLESDQDRKCQEIWLNSNKTDFKLISRNQPKKLMVDPDYHIPTVRWMPPRLLRIWDGYPDMIVIYGTIAESKANKSAAERFNEEFLGLDQEIVKADSLVKEEDLKIKRVILFGRPETNAITNRFTANFPIQFHRDLFKWQGTTYDKPTQGIAQVIENPLNSKSMMILYAGLSGGATQNVCDKSEWRHDLDGSFIIDFDASYVIFDGHNKVVSGDWENVNSDVVVTF